MEQSVLDLLLYHLEMGAGFALCEYFADAEDHFHAFGQYGVHFLSEKFVRFAEVLAAFGVSEDDFRRSGRFGDRSRYFTRVSSAGLGIDVLGRYGYRGAFQLLGYGIQVGKHGSYDDFYSAQGASGQSGFDFTGQSDAFLEVFVHFPVAGYDFSSHLSILFSKFIFFSYLFFCFL